MRPSLLAAALLACHSTTAQTPSTPFSFSGRAAQDAHEEAAKAAERAAQVEQLTSVACAPRLKRQKIVLVIAERDGALWNTSQERYGPLFQLIDARLRALGLNTFTAEEIKASVAQAELDAYFKNDPDAALAASKRLGASYVLRGSITQRAGLNPVVSVPEVAVNVDLTLAGASGRIVSQVAARSDAYSSPDTLATAIALVREQADLLVARLYNDYCREGAP